MNWILSRSPDETVKTASDFRRKFYSHMSLGCVSGIFLKIVIITIKDTIQSGNTKVHWFVVSGSDALTWGDYFFREADCTYPVSSGNRV